MWLDPCNPQRTALYGRKSVSNWVHRCHVLLIHSYLIQTKQMLVVLLSFHPILNRLFKALICNDIGLRDVSQQFQWPISKVITSNSHILIIIDGFFFFLGSSFQIDSGCAWPQSTFLYHKQAGSWDDRNWKPLSMFSTGFKPSLRL
jgi:hypothetical protein